MHRRNVTQSDFNPIVNGGFIPWGTCRLALQLVWSGSQRRIPYLTPTLSNVGTLSIEFPQPSRAPDVTDILANLPLPCLENLTFCTDYFSPLPWPHADFLALSSRSSFHTHLQSLNISDFSIGAAELAECCPLCLQCSGWKFQMILETAWNLSSRIPFS
jgi:hypothetical protein